MKHVFHTAVVGLTVCLSMNPSFAVASTLGQDDATTTLVVEGRTTAALVQSRNNLEYVETYFGNGELESRSVISKGQLHGVTQHFYPNGNLRLQGNYSDGEMEGELKQFFETGQLQQLAQYRQGKRCGKTLRYSAEGMLEETANYFQGSLKRLERYYDSGEPMFVISQGVNLEGYLLFEFDRDGELINKTHLADKRW